MNLGIFISGGIDSTVLLADIIRRQYNLPDNMKAGIYPITFNEGDFDSAYRAAREVIIHYQLQRTHIDIRFMDSWDIVLGDGHTFPGMKMAMFVAAMSYAHSYGLQQIYLGYTKENVKWPDNSEEFIKSVSDLYNRTYGTSIEFLSPYRLMSKKDVVGIGKLTNVPFDITYSCRNDRECGVCDKCIERKECLI